MLWLHHDMSMLLHKLEVNQSIHHDITTRLPPQVLLHKLCDPNSLQPVFTGVTMLSLAHPPHKQI